MMLRVFYPMNRDFLARHNGTEIDHYWANWDLCNTASMDWALACCDNRSIYNDAVEYFKTGGGNGSIKHAVTYVHPAPSASGRKPVATKATRRWASG